MQKTHTPPHHHTHPAQPIHYTPKKPIGRGRPRELTNPTRITIVLEQDEADLLQALSTNGLSKLIRGILTEHLATQYPDHAKALEDTHKATLTRLRQAKEKAGRALHEYETRMTRAITQRRQHTQTQIHGINRAQNKAWLLARGAKPADIERFLELLEA